MNDHSGGWTGLISDDTAGGSTITLPEHADAFQAAAEAAGVERFALMINDACLMSSVEYLTMVAPYFDYAAVYVAIDDPSGDMLMQLHQFNPRPSCIVDSGGK